MRFLLLTLTCVLLLAGCSSSAATPRQPRHVPTTVRWGLVGLTDVPTLDPVLVSDAPSISVTSLIYGGLVRLDHQLRVKPDGAARWTISRDGKVYTFFLRRNLRFADGRLVTAYDVAASLQRALGPEGSAGTAAAYLKDIAHETPHRGTSSGTGRAVTAVNARAVRITLDHPAAHFLAALAFPSSYIPDPAVQRRYGSAWTDHAAGFGPFSVSSWRHGRSLTLVRNPYFYGGVPPLKRIDLTFYEQNRSALTAYEGGRLDLVSGMPPGQSISSTVPGAQALPALAMDYLAFNTRRLPFYRLKARRAFASVVTTGLIRQAVAGPAFAVHRFLPAVFNVTVPLWKPTAQGRAYLSAARYPNPAHFPHVALIIPQDPNVLFLAEALRSAWREKLGVKVDIHPLNPSDYSTVLNAHVFDLALVRWGADYPDPQDFLGTQLGSSSDNVTGWTPRSYDRAITLADSYNPIDPRRMSLFAEAARLAASKVPILPLDQPSVTAFISPNVTAIALTPLGTITGEWAQARFVR